MTSLRGVYDNVNRVVHAYAHEFHLIVTEVLVMTKVYGLGFNGVDSTYALTDLIVAHYTQSTVSRSCRCIR